MTAELENIELAINKKIAEVNDHPLHWFLMCYTQDMIEKYGLANEKVQTFIKEMISKTKSEVELWLDDVWANSNSAKKKGCA